jgi:hypothetical protein
MKREKGYHSRNTGICINGANNLTASRRWPQTLLYLAVLIPSFLLLQALLILMHEYTHSSVAWLLGDIRSPLDIVWGSPLLMTGWDEGVGYKALFAAGKLHDAAIIGVSPLIMHSVMVGLCLALMLGKSLASRRWLFHLVFWFYVANLMELIAYILMRGFSSHGDTGNFNRGMELSPWWLFIIGSLALAVVLYIFYKRALPRMYALFAPENPVLQWTILIAAGFIMFFWGSGIRVMLYLYPDPQWAFGLLAFPAMALVIYAFRPSKTEAPWARKS